MIKTEIEWFTLDEKMPDKKDVLYDNRPESDKFIGCLIKFDNNSVYPGAFVIAHKMFIDCEENLMKEAHIAYWAYLPEGPKP